MSAYLIVQAKIADMEQFAPYGKIATELVEKNGGRYLVRGGAVTPLEGSWDSETKVVVSVWPDRERALQFWNSPQYREAVKMREGAGEFTITLVEGID